MDKKKAVFFDIDGTIFLPGIGIPESTKKAIKLLKENNILTVVCTGRARSLVTQNIIDLGFDAIIAGAGTFVEYNNEIIYRKNLDNDIAAEMVTEIRKHGLFPLLEGHIKSYYDNTIDDSSYHEIINRYFKDSGPNMFPIPDDYSKLDIAKISARFTPHGDSEGLITKYKDRFTIVDHNGMLLEFIPNYSSKAVGIEKFLEYSGVSIDNTYAFGDSMNDLEMIEYVKYGIAMGNSDPKLIECTEYVTDSIENDGIYNGLKKFNLI